MEGLSALGAAPPIEFLPRVDHATMFATGVPAWTLWMALKTKPPPSEKTSQRSSASVRTSSGAPNGSVFCVSTPPRSFEVANRVLENRYGRNCPFMIANGMFISMVGPGRDGGA
jgi:hypothetical protein